MIAMKTPERGQISQYVRAALHEVEDPQTAPAAEVAASACQLANNDGVQLNVKAQDVHVVRNTIRSKLGIRYLTPLALESYVSQLRKAGRPKQVRPETNGHAANGQAAPERAARKGDETFTLADIRLARQLAGAFKGIRLEDVTRLRELIALMGESA